MGFIHQLDHWPAFAWDSEALVALLGAVRHEQGKHLGKMGALGFRTRAEANLVVLTEDVVKSWAIEGETLNPEEVRSSIARRLGIEVSGLPPAGREVDGVVEMMLDATQHYSNPLTADRLFGWHAALFPTARSGLRRITVGAWRPAETDPMQVVSGPIGREKVHFEAVSAERLESEMVRFLEWFNSPQAIDPVLAAGIAHFWFITIHPFEDGNGRMARAISDMALARADGSKDRFYSLSAQIEAERRQYYLQLEAAQRGSLDITAWLQWFLGCLDRAIQGAEKTLAQVLRKDQAGRERVGRLVEKRVWILPGFHRFWDGVRSSQDRKSVLLPLPLPRMQSKTAKLQSKTPGRGRCGVGRGPRCTAESR